MSFVSPEFLIFYAVALTFYFLLPFRFRWILLLIASYFFYTYWNSTLIVLIIASTSVDYIAGRLIARIPVENQLPRRLWLIASLTVNLGFLFTFKYYNFFITSASEALNYFNIDHSLTTLELILPVGISFYTFQSMAYTIDVYRGKIDSEKHFGIFALYISFFPQIIAGPIERAANLLPQFRQNHPFDYERVVLGLRLILWGFFKKVVIADRVAPYVNEVFANPDQYTGMPVIVAAIFFTIQIYCDFSAYSDIAIGTAKIMGFNLSINFKQPLLATTIQDFWRRWHITLMSWFTDYVYIPLGGGRVALWRILLNIMIVFAISGLWHGANWTFILWGTINGFFVALNRLWRQWGNSPSFPVPLAWAYTQIIVIVTFVIFRADTIDIASTLISNGFDLSAGFSTVMLPYENGLLDASLAFVLAWISIASLFLYDYIDSDRAIIREVERLPKVVRWAGYYGIVSLVYLSLIFGSVVEEFIYFQF